MFVSDAAGVSTNYRADQTSFTSDKLQINFHHFLQMLLSLLSSAQCGSFVQQTVGRKGRDAPFFLHRHSTRPIARKIKLSHPVVPSFHPAVSQAFRHQADCTQSGRCSVRSAPHFVPVRIQNVPKAGHKHSFSADSNRRLDRSFPFSCALYPLSYRSHGRESNPRHHNVLLTPS